jgi:hypothetical protein
MKKQVSEGAEGPLPIRDTRLWQQVSRRREYALAIHQIRKIAEVLARKIENTLPDYTDHSIKHLDALWSVTDQVLTDTEFNSLTSSEAFLLGASYYVHDLGMALPATADGKHEIERSNAYESALARFKSFYPIDEARAAELALREATREVHAKSASHLATKPIPGLGQYLIEDSDLRSRWAHLIAQVAESHHWSLEDVEHKLGSRKVAPGPDGENIDLAYVACILRVVDFAHISRARAPRLDRLLRRSLSLDSAVHWDALAHITGPTRQGDLLVFGCTEPVNAVDAWWLFHDLAVGLDAEIKAVHDYLRNRTVSASRFTLFGVKGVEDPTTFNLYVQLPPEVIPIDVRVQPDSMERVVELLGGKHIYGGDRLAPLRELIQNARDAVELRLALDRASGRSSTPAEIKVSVTQGGEEIILCVSDNGIGMTRNIIRKYLVGVGSDFWGSVDFYRDFSRAVDAGFRPIGRFGIGFLSVFMLGERVEVETEAAGGNRVKLRLLGVGRRGELSESKPTGKIGTEIRIVLKSMAMELTKNLPSIVRARAPMLSVPVQVSVNVDGFKIEESIPPGWWKIISPAELCKFAQTWELLAHLGAGEQDEDLGRRYRRYSSHFSGKWSISGWPGSRPEFLGESERLISLGGAAGAGVVACSQGIAINVQSGNDLAGLIDLGVVELTTSRRSMVDERKHGASDPRVESTSGILKRAMSDILPAVVGGLDGLDAFGMMPGRIRFVRAIASAYGQSVLDSTTLRWIPVTEPPGNLVHRSKQELKNELKKQNQIVLCSGLSVGGAYGAAHAHIPAVDLGNAIVIATSIEEIQVDFDTRRKLEVVEGRTSFSGPIDDLLKLAEVEGETSSSESELVLMDFFIKCVAEAWGRSADSIRRQEWHIDCANNVLWGYLKRGELTGRPPQHRKYNAAAPKR